MPSKTKARSKAHEVPTEADLTGKEEQNPKSNLSDDEIEINSLFLAVAEQDLEKLAECISKGHDLNKTPLKACTPLLLAVKMGNFEMVRLLVQNGASCCGADENGTTILHHAAVNGLARIAIFLVEVGGAVLDQQNQSGCTPLYQAVQHGHIECVRTFLTLKADVEARTRTGATPLYIASDRGNSNLANVLLDVNADANAKTELQMTPLLVAAFNGHRDVVRSLLSRNVDIEQRGPCGGTALYVAAQEGRRSVVEFLVQQGAIVDARCDGDGNLTPSLIASMQGHDDLVRLLLEAKGDIDVRTGKGSTLAIMAARHGQTNVLKMLVEVGGPKVLDGQDNESLSVLGASKAGRHAETTSFIKKALEARREADLSAWEASLPDIIQQFDPPCKKKTKAKSNHRGKKSEAGVSERVEDNVSVLQDQTSHVEEIAAAEITDAGAVCLDIANCHVTTSVDTSSDRSGDNGPWKQVKRKGHVKPVIAIAPPESPASLSHEEPTPAVSPISALSAPGPVTPVSAQCATPCGTTSPFGLGTVLPLWPSTPEAWPHFEAGLSSAFWPSIPPPSMADTISLALSEKAHPSAHLQDHSGYLSALPAYQFGIECD